VGGWVGGEGGGVQLKHVTCECLLRVEGTSEVHRQVSEDVRVDTVVCAPWGGVPECSERVLQGNGLLNVPPCISTPSLPPFLPLSPPPHQQLLQGDVQPGAQETHVPRRSMQTWTYHTYNAHSVIMLTT
jgi:hypothetical protein